MLTEILVSAISIAIGMFIYRNNETVLSPILDKVDKVFNKIKSKISKK